MKHGLEELAPQLCSQELEKRLLCLEKVIKNKTLAISKAPEGRIRCVKQKHHVEYYLILQKGDKNGKYLPRTQDSIAKVIIQRDYDRKLLVNLMKERAVLKKLLRVYTSAAVENLFESLSLSRKTIVTPVTLPAEEFVQKWKSVEYSHKGFTEENSDYYSINGLRLRSKSEVIIANTLDHYGIPFRYEFPVTLKNEHGVYIDVHPDFYCLNVRTRKEILWEHFGLMDFSDYCGNALQKIKLYEKNNFEIGDTFIFTMETSTQPLSAKEIERKIKHYLI